MAKSTNLRNAAGRRGEMRRDRYQRALVEALETRVLMSGSYAVTDFMGTWGLGGLNKAGNITSGGDGTITAGQWTNQSGPPPTDVIFPGSTYSIQSGGSVNMTLLTQPDGVGDPVTTSLAGSMNATKDLIALNEETLGAGNAVTSVNGLDLLVDHSGTFQLSDVAGTWNIAAQDFRGTVTVNASGHITGGQIFLESNQKVANVTGGTATLNADGTGTLSFTTAFTGANAAFASEDLAITMDNSKDLAVGNSADIGQPLSAPATGNVPAELTVLVKNSGVYAKSDILGTPWTIAGAQGAGTITFTAKGAVTGSLTRNDGTTVTISGNYQLGGNGTVIINLTFTRAGGGVTHESLFGTVNRSKNTIALDRAIQNGDLSSSLTVLVNPANHAPTERAKIVWPTSAFQQSAVTFDFPTLTSQASVHDLDNDTLAYTITNVNSANGVLTITHLGVTTVVQAGVTEMVAGDTLTWVPSATAAGEVEAFDFKATDGTASAANATQVFVPTSALAIVTATAKKGTALEALAGSAKGDGTIQIQRSGGDMTSALTVTITVGGTAHQGVNYDLLDPTNATISTSTATITIPAGQSSVLLTVVPVQDNAVDPTLDIAVTVDADPNTASPSYLPSVHPTGHVALFDSDPTVTIVPRQPSVLEGQQGQPAFIITLLPAQGASLTGSTTVHLNYSNSTFNIANLIAPSQVVFGPGDVKKVVTISTTDDGIADPLTQIVADISGSGFAVGTGDASINVIDAAPTVSIVAKKKTAIEGQPGSGDGEFIIHRSGSTANPLTVDLSTASGGDYGTLGTNYTLTDASGNSLTNTVVISAGVSDEAITVTPIDDHKNDITLRAQVTLAADSGPSYRVGNSLATVLILNDDRFPTLQNHLITETTQKNTTLDLTFDQLVSATGAALNPGDTNGTLQLEVEKSLTGHLRLIPNGQTQSTAAVAGTIIAEGDTLEWTPPTGVQNVSLKAFTLAAVDGTVTSLGSALFTVSVT